MVPPLIFGSPTFWRVYLALLFLAAWLVRERPLPPRAQIALGAFIVTWWVCCWWWNLIRLAVPVPSADRPLTEPRSLP